MRKQSSAYTIAAIAVAVVLLIAPAGRAQESRPDIEAAIEKYLAERPEAIQRIMKDYLIKNPEMLQDALIEIMKKRQPSAAAANAGKSDAEKSEAIKTNAKLLFESSHQVTLGNPKGDVTLVEFFDYNCGYCKRAFADMMTVMKADPNVRIVLKEFPILGPGSAEAARVAVAVRMQDDSGEKYLAFHQKMLLGRGAANKDGALAAAKEAGLDMARLETDMASEEVDKTLAESVTLARALGINGTPGYVIGDTIIPGAIGAAGLKDKIDNARRRPG